MALLQEEEWQTTRPKVSERIAYMFNNDLFSDVCLVLQTSIGAVNVIPAHKFVLSISSPVFHSMFYGEGVHTTSTVHLSDCDYESIFELLRYMYTDEVKLSSSNVMQVLYLAKKYNVPSLAEKCVEYVGRNLNASNVLTIMHQAQKFKEENVIAGCWKIIDNCTSEVVKSDEFLTVNHSILEDLAGRDSLTVHEAQLFEAVNCWAISECQRRGLIAHGSAKRRVLGERIVKSIRFPVMTQAEFAAVVLDSKILKTGETFKMIKYFSSVPHFPVGFPVNKRFKKSHEHHRLFRFDTVADYGWRHDLGRQDSIFLTVDTEVKLYAIGICGSVNKQYSVIFRIREATSGSIVLSKRGTFTSELVQCPWYRYYGFSIVFDLPVILKGGVKYSIEAKITGPFSCRGFNGVQSVRCSRINFKFENCQCSDNGTNIAKGQFPMFEFGSN